MAIFIERRGDIVTLLVWTQPNASKTAFAEEYDGRIRLRVAAPAVDGAANKAVVEFIAKAFGVPKRRVEISKGLAARRKSVIITEPNKDPFG